MTCSSSDIGRYHLVVSQDGLDNNSLLGNFLKNGHRAKSGIQTHARKQSIKELIGAAPDAVNKIRERFIDKP